MSVRPTPRRRVLLWRGVTRACAVCGRRGITKNWVTLRAQCPRCGFRFERDPGHFVGAVGMSTIVTFALMLIALLAGFGLMWPDVRFFPLVIPLLFIAIVVPIAFHANAKTLWVAIDLSMRPLEAGEAIGGTEESPPQQG